MERLGLEAWGTVRELLPRHFPTLRFLQPRGESATKLGGNHGESSVVAPCTPFYHHGVHVPIPGTCGMCRTRSARAHPCRGNRSITYPATHFRSTSRLIRGCPGSHWTVCRCTTATLWPPHRCPMLGKGRDYRLSTAQIRTSVTSFDRFLFRGYNWCLLTISYSPFSHRGVLKYLLLYPWYHDYALVSSRDPLDITRTCTIQCVRRSSQR